MRRRISEWRRRKRREVFREQAVTYQSRREVARLWAWAFVLMPRDAAAMAHMVFRRWTCLPGDVFEDFQRDCLFVVRRKVRGGVEAWRVPGGVVYMGLSCPPSLGVEDPHRWTLPTREQAQRARAAVLA